MNIYIQTDVEGVAGVPFFDNRTDRTREVWDYRQRIYRLMTGEINAAAKAAFDAGATKVLINDSHGTGYNLFFEDLDERCTIFHGRNETYPFWLGGFDGGWDAMVLVGMHAMGGTKNAFLPHSKWVLNGSTYLSEAGMAVHLAGYFHVPVAFVSGDEAVVADISSLVPDISSAAVKKACGPYCGISVMPARAQAMIAEGVRSALATLNDRRPFQLPKPPYRLNLLDSPAHIPPFKPVLERDIESDDFLDLFQKAIKSFPWNKPGLENVDGFRFNA